MSRRWAAQWRSLMGSGGPRSIARDRDCFRAHLALVPVEGEALPFDWDAREHARREAAEAIVVLLLALVAHPRHRAALRVQLADLGDLALAEEGVNLRRGLERGRLGQYPSHDGGGGGGGVC